MNYEFNKFTLKFKDPNVEKRYQRKNRSTAVGGAKIAALTLTIIFLIFVIGATINDRTSSVLIWDGCGIVINAIGLVLLFLYPGMYKILAIAL